MGLELRQGRPQNCAGRLQKEVAVYELLDGLGVDYAHVDHPVAPTMEECDEAGQVLGCTICKNLFLCNRQQTDFYLLVLPGRKHFKTKELSGQLGVARLSFAGEALLDQMLGLTPGSVTVMGLAHDPQNRVRLLMDRDLLQNEYFACHPCINTTSIKLKTADLLERVLPALGHAPTLVTLLGEEETL